MNLVVYVYKAAKFFDRMDVMMNIKFLNNMKAKKA